MNSKSLAAMGFACLIAALAASCGKHEQEKAPDKTPEKSAEPESRVKHGTNGEIIITLDSETQTKMRLQTRELTAAGFAPEAHGYGRVQDMSALGGIIADLQGARIAAETARQELTRLKTLSEQNNASQKALQTAQA